MEDNKKMGRLAGVFLLLMVGTGIPGVLFRGISGSMLENQELSSTLTEQSADMRISILLAFVAGVFGILFSVTAYRVLSPHSKFVATTYLVLWIFQVAIATMGDACHYVLLETAQFFEETERGGEDFLAIASISIKGYAGAHYLSLIIFSGSFVFLHANFMKFGLLPKWLTIWGMLATGTVFTVTWLRIFDESVSFHFYNQNGLFMIGFTVYMLLKGFRNVKSDEMIR